MGDTLYVITNHARQGHLCVHQLDRYENGRAVALCGRTFRMFTVTDLPGAISIGGACVLHDHPMCWWCAAAERRAHPRSEHEAVAALLGEKP